MRRCKNCGGIIDRGKRRHAQYCDDNCRANAKYARNKRQLIRYYERKEEENVSQPTNP